ncbi:hypothetical protein BYT27DRAFT_7219882 [Phlegmacium glaucopus]|nr:hypothetical protein BYT27DRAFT_7219882 [Phlegmacium glaucopus]
MDKTNGCVQVLNSRVFFSPNCSCTVEYPPPIQDERGGKPNPFLPSHQPNKCCNYFELDTTKYASPRWWTLAFGWISFFPLMPSFCGPIFEKLFMPRNHHHVFNEELGEYFMPLSLSNKWLQVDRDLSDAVYLIRHQYLLPFVYPINTSGFGYSKSHKRSGALHMALRRGRDWFVVWMALLSYTIAGAENIHSSAKDSVTLAKPSWYDILLEHFDAWWLEALHASTVCLFSHTPRAGVFLKLEVFDSNQPLPKFFCRFHVPVWYPWSSEGTTFLTKSPHPSTSTLMPSTSTPMPSTSTPMPSTSTPMPSLPPFAGSSTQPKQHITWAEFILQCKKHYEERVRKETPQEQQVRLARLRNPPKISAKVFEWLVDDNGDLYRQAIPKKMRKDILDSYLARQIYYDPIENEYDCCEEYDSGAPGGPLDDSDSDDVSWDGDDVGMNQAGEDRIPPARVPSPDIEINDSWNLQSVEAPNPSSPDNFIAEVHRILFMHFGYTPVIPAPTFHDPVLKTEKDRLRGSISADEWDLSRENRQSIFFSTHLKAIRCVDQGLFMFDFKDRSTVTWKLTVKTAAHALLVCRLDSHLNESDLAYYLLQNGIPFHTLQLSTTLGRSPISRHPPLVIPFRPANYEFTWRDYEAFRQQCHVIFKQPRGRAALLRGYYPWRLAINDISLSSVISGPSGWSTDPNEMLVVKLPETGEEFIDDKLTDTELKLLSGTYDASTSQHASLSWYPSIIKFENSGRNAGRWTEVEEREFSVRHSRHTGAGIQ